jgi:pimeloyl-ACP methyl ester carboxylesterase
MKLLFTGIIAGLFLVSCSLQDRDLAPPAAGPSVAGVITGSSGKGQVYAVLYELDNKKHRPVVDQLIGKNGRFEFPVASKSVFGVAAFEDLNGNLRQDRGEYAGYVRFPQVKMLPSGKAPPVMRRNITLRKRTKKLASPIVLSEEAALEAERQTRLDSRRGVAKTSPPKKATAPASAAKKPVQRDVVNLGASRFSQASAAAGFRDPGAFQKQQGSGLYLVDPYRANKQPVIFVHGVGGAAQDWRNLFPRLDLGRTQPLVYQYPTGMSLEAATSQLLNFTGSMSKKYRFRDVQVVGLGTGGLIAKAFALRSRSVRVTSLVTLGTPWGGVNVPTGKVQRGHVSWDLRANSPFLKQARRSFSGPHHLLFAYEDAQALPSQLDPRVQDAATRVQGFPTDVVGLVRSSGAAQEVRRGLGRRK